jgi:hypothetical protein
LQHRGDLPINGAGHQDLACPGMRHQPGRDIDRIAQHAELRTLRRPDGPDHNRAGSDADADLEPKTPTCG